MPRIRRSGLPRKLFDQEPIVPEEAWFKRFDTFILCGEGELVKTVLTPKQSAIGEEVD